MFLLNDLPQPRSQSKFIPLYPWYQTLSKKTMREFGTPNLIFVSESESGTQESCSTALLAFFIRLRDQRMSYEHPGNEVGSISIKSKKAPGQPACIGAPLVAESGLILYRSFPKM